MRRLRTLSVSFLSLVFASTALARTVVISWPSPAFRTLQSAIDAAPDGATISIAAGDYAIAEPLVIVGKQLVIRGAGSGRRGGAVTRLVGPEPQSATDERGQLILRASSVRGLFSVRKANVFFRAMVLSGFDAGVAVHDAERETPSAVGIQDLLIVRTGRGVLAETTGQVVVVDSTIKATRWNAISVVSSGHAFAAVSGVTIDVSIGSGIYFENTTMGVAGTSVSGAFNGGIVGFNGALIASACALKANRIGGMILDNSGSLIFDNQITGSVPTADGFAGDGVMLWNGSSSTLTDNMIDNNGRAGISLFGSTALLHDNAMHCNAFDIDEETLNGSVSKATDNGGNVCGCGQDAPCAAVSSQLMPPEPTAGNG
jgi:parallel beta-helix repeat protein